MEAVDPVGFPGVLQALCSCPLDDEQRASSLVADHLSPTALAALSVTSQSLRSAFASRFRSALEAAEASLHAQLCLSREEFETLGSAADFRRVGRKSFPLLAHLLRAHPTVVTATLGDGPIPVRKLLAGTPPPLGSEAYGCASILTLVRPGGGGRHDH
jgi:hypothetical protein